MSPEIKSAGGPAVAEKAAAKPKITVFHCFNAINDVTFAEGTDYELESIKLPCSSMMREVVMLKAFESGADAVVVVTCPEGACRYLQGNLRNAKRVARVKKILDEIGLGAGRLNQYSIPHGDQAMANSIIKKTLQEIAVMGPNPAA